MFIRKPYRMWFLAVCCTYAVGFCAQRENWVSIVTMIILVFVGSWAIVEAINGGE